MIKKKIIRERIGTSLDKELYKKIQMLAIAEDTSANMLIEEGMRRVLESRKRKKTSLQDENP